ncbi:hypothetical protein ACHCAL_10570 [Providencia huaxiensis]|uniref:hypothetical protein n=1 Tax=Providencia huaxiensis TaxID=2027290 RepID=UPI003756E8DC
MKKMLALAIATALASPMALADNPPSNVGDVTYLGNIVANSPMWQWTVNDYPGGRLDAKPSEVVEANGTYTYPLNGQAFIAASGYLPSLTPITQLVEGSRKLGLMDKTALYDMNGDTPTVTAPSADTQPDREISIAATGTNSSGARVTGTLTLMATEIRGSRLIYKIGNDITSVTTLAGDNGVFPEHTGSCWAYGIRSSAITTSGTTLSPVITGPSQTSTAAFLNSLAHADNSGSVKYATITAANPPTKDTASVNGTYDCDSGTLNMLPVNSPSDRTHYLYAAAGHVLELQPKTLKFNEQLSGIWSATLTVTAYQM